MRFLKRFRSTKYENDDFRPTQVKFSLPRIWTVKKKIKYSKYNMNSSTERI